jgi:hypothetical protein
MAVILGSVGSSVSEEEAEAEEVGLAVCRAAEGLMVGTGSGTLELVVSTAVGEGVLIGIFVCLLGGGVAGFLVALVVGLLVLTVDAVGTTVAMVVDGSIVAVAADEGCTVCGG